MTPTQQQIEQTHSLTLNVLREMGVIPPPSPEPPPTNVPITNVPITNVPSGGRIWPGWIKNVPIANANPPIIKSITNTGKKYWYYDGEYYADLMEAKKVQYQNIKSGYSFDGEPENDIIEIKKSDLELNDPKKLDWAFE